METKVNKFQFLENNLKARNEMILEIETDDLPCDQFNDPLNSVQ